VVSQISCYRLPSCVYTSLPHQLRHFNPSSEKMSLIFAFWQPFLGPDGVNKIHPDLRAIGGLLAMGNSAVFWQSGVNMTSVFICIETDGFTRFPGSARTSRNRIGACIGLIFATLTKNTIQSRLPGSYPACFSPPSSGTGFFHSIIGFQGQ
jgi:hypothetical protein